MESFSKIWIIVPNSAYQKMLKFLEAGKKVEIPNFFGWFWLKDKLTEQKPIQQFPLFTVKSCGKFQQSLNPGFQFSLAKNDKITSSRHEGWNFKFLHLVWAKRWIDLSKNRHISFLSWQWSAVESFSKIWLLVSNSATQKLDFLRENKPIKFQISTFSPARRNFTIFG